jgi:hypothetical protein
MLRGSEVRSTPPLGNALLNRKKKKKKPSILHVFFVAIQVRWFGLEFNRNKDNEKEKRRIMQGHELAEFGSCLALYQNVDPIDQDTR